MTHNPDWCRRKTEETASTDFRTKLFGILGDPCCHTSLKRCLLIFLDCDPVDAATDADFLAQLMSERCALVLRGQAAHGGTDE